MHVCVYVCMRISVCVCACAHKCLRMLQDAHEARATNTFWTYLFCDARDLLALWGRRWWGWEAGKGVHACIITLPSSSCEP